MAEFFSFSDGQRIYECNKKDLDMMKSIVRVIALAVLIPALLVVYSDILKNDKQQVERLESQINSEFREK